MYGEHQMSTWVYIRSLALLECRSQHFCTTNEITRELIAKWHTWFCMHLLNLSRASYLETHRLYQFVQFFHED